MVTMSAIRESPMPASASASASAAAVSGPAVSIVVLNYNYGRFVAAAIESALAQTAPGCEVIVVDNGSTDDSAEVIARYADRVRVVRQPVNIGQGQGYNLGIAAARGQWIVWLDADDLLDPDAIATCMAAADDSTAKVQYALRLIDAEGRPLGGTMPYLSHHGDVVPIIRRLGHYAGPPGSGNLYRLRAVAPYFPVEPKDWPICTDTVPFLTAPFHGRVVHVERPLGSYRLHRKPADRDAPGYRGNYSGSVGQEVRLVVDSRERTLELLRQRSGFCIDAPALMLPTHVRHRITSWRWARESHPFPEDSAESLWALMRASLQHCPGYGEAQRAALLAWAAGALFLPAPMAGAVMNGAQPLREALDRWRRRSIS